MAEERPRRRRELETEDELRALSNPLRTRILHHAAEPVSARELSDHLSVPITRLYFHLDQLVDYGFLEVATIEKSGAQLTRRFVRTAEDFGSSPDLLERLSSTREGLGLMASLVVEPIRTQVERYLAEGDVPGSEVTQSILRLTPELADQVVARVGEVLDDARRQAAEIARVDTALYAFSLIIGPMEGETT